MVGTMASSEEAAAERDENNPEFLELQKIREHLNPPTEFSDSSQYLPLDRMKDVLLNDDHENAPVLRNGITISREGIVNVATSVIFPSSTPASLAWWFGGGCKGDVEYKKWHPEDHVSGAWFRPSNNENDSHTSHNSDYPWIGCEHRVIEALGAKSGGQPLTLRIKFCDPSEYGINEKMLKDAKCEYAFTARVCIRDPALRWLDVGHFIHFTKPLSSTQNIQNVGFELRSRFWLGDVALSNDVGYPLTRNILSPIIRYVANTRSVRSVASRIIEGRSQLQVAIANWTHACEEFGILTSFLTEEYEKSSKH